jgi:hypothetical protein
LAIFLGWPKIEAGSAFHLPVFSGNPDVLGKVAHVRCVPKGDIAGIVSVLGVAQGMDRNMLILANGQTCADIAIPSR